MVAMDPRQSALIPAAIIIGLASFSFSVEESTQIYLIEQSVCRERYSLADPFFTPGGSLVDETLCKLPEIQSQVSLINGVLNFLSFLPALILTGPWGELARVFGKKNVVLLNGCGFTLGPCYFLTIVYYHQVFDIRLIWLKPVFNLVGGGTVIAMSLVYTYIAESVESKNLSGVFYKLAAVSLSMSFFGLSLSSYLLRTNIWLLSFLGILASALTMPVSLLFPSIPSYGSQTTSSSHVRRPSNVSDSGVSSEASSLLFSLPTSKSPSPPSALRTVFEALKSNPRLTIDLFTSILYTSKASRFTIFTFFLLTLVDNIRVILTQWASVTYSWIIADVHALSSIGMIVSSTVLLCLPIFTKKYLAPRLGSSSCVDIFVSKLALCFRFLGLALMSIAPTRVYYILALVVYNLGSPLMDSLRSFSTGLIGDREEVQKMYLGMGMVEMLGGMAGTAIWSGLFSSVVGKCWIVERAPFWGCLATMFGIWFVLMRLEKFGRGATTMSNDNDEEGQEDA